MFILILWKSQLSSSRPKNGSAFSESFRMPAFLTRMIRPLTPKMKFQLAVKASTDLVTAAGVALDFCLSAGRSFSAVRPRFGGLKESDLAPLPPVVSLTSWSAAHTAIPAAPAPTLLLSGNWHHRYQNPPCVFSRFVARGDSGKWQPNYSSLG
jgi:hypothetical protein